MKVYIVRGSTGEYSYRTDWIVCGFLDKQKADDHASACDKWCVQHNTQDWVLLSDVQEKNPYDKNASYDYTGNTYWVEECEIVDGP